MATQSGDVEQAANVAPATATRQEFLTLQELSSSSYYQLPKKGTELDAYGLAGALNPFYKTLRNLVAYGNLELVLMKNVGTAAEKVLRQGARREVAAQLQSVSNGERIAGTTAAWSGFQIPDGMSGNVLDPSGWEMDARILGFDESEADGSQVSLAGVQREIRKLVAEAKKDLKNMNMAVRPPGYADQNNPEQRKQLAGVVRLFEAYSADMLGSIGADSSGGAALTGASGWSRPSKLTTTKTPAWLADLAAEFLDLLTHKVDVECAKFVWLRLIKAACQSGNVELVKKLLPAGYGGYKADDPDHLRLAKLGLRPGGAPDVVKTFAAAWVGYEAGEKRSGQRDDWLDYKHAGTRARDMASAVVWFLILEQGDTADDGSGQMLKIRGSHWQMLKDSLQVRPASCQPVVGALLHVAKELEEAAKALQELPQTSGDVHTNAVDKVHIEIREGAAAILVVEALEVAIFTQRLEAVEEAFGVLEGNPKTWPYVNLGIIGRLVDRYPHHAVALLDKISQKHMPEVTFDHVLPIAIQNGSYAVAVSTKDMLEFGQESGQNVFGRSVTNKISDHFSTTKPDDVIEAILVRQYVTWFGFFFLFDFVREFGSNTVQRLQRIWWHSMFAFVMQGPGSFILGVLLSIGVFLLGVLCTIVELVFITLIGGICWVINAGQQRIMRFFKSDWKRMGAKVQQLRRRNNRVHPGATSSAEQGRDAAGRRFKEWAVSTLNAPHYAVVDFLLGWNKTLTAITCRQMPIPVDFSKQEDTKLLSRLLGNRSVPSSVFGCKVLKPMIYYKWHSFTKLFILMQLALHVVYMAAFIVYAWTIKDMQPLEVSRKEEADGGRIWGCKGSESCRLPAPTLMQFILLLMLGAITVDFFVQETRQVVYFKLKYFTHTWDFLDVSSVILMGLIISAHLVCAVSAEALRTMAAVQVLLLFMRLQYYGMAFEGLGAFVSMVRKIAEDLVWFAVFLVVVFVGFALAMIVAQGQSSSSTRELMQGIMMRLFTLMYGDNVHDYMEKLPFIGNETGGAAPSANEMSGATLGAYYDAGSDDTSDAADANHLFRVFVAFFMILVALVLLNLLIAIVNESYERIRMNSQWESYRNKAMLIVSTDALLHGFGPWWFIKPFKAHPHFTTWLYHSLASPMDAPAKDEKRYLYVVRPERARAKVQNSALDAGGDDDDEGEWNGRMAELKRLIDKQEQVIMCNTVPENLNKLIAKIDKKLADLGNSPDSASHGQSPAAAAISQKDPARIAGENVGQEVLRRPRGATAANTGPDGGGDNGHGAGNDTSNSTSNGIGIGAGKGNRPAPSALLPLPLLSPRKNLLAPIATRKAAAGASASTQASPVPEARKRMPGETSPDRNS